jgi:hypothetical protein
MYPRSVLLVVLVASPFLPNRDRNILSVAVSIKANQVFDKVSR